MREEVFGISLNLHHYGRDKTVLNKDRKPELSDSTVACIRQNFLS